MTLEASRVHLTSHSKEFQQLTIAVLLAVRHSGPRGERAGDRWLTRKGLSERDMFLVQHLREWMTCRRLTAGLLLVTSLLMVLPISLPMVASVAEEESSEKDLSAPFPCQARRCGCRSAAQCWKKCCCFTDTQKVAWAKANRVSLPAFVVAAAEREAPAAKVTCHRTEVCCKTEKTVRPRAKSRPRDQVVVGVEALQCQGVEQTVAGVLVSLLPPELLTVVLTNFDTGEVRRLADLPLAPCEQEPPTPPPRIGVA